jgi:acetyl esterase/lipase
MRLDDTFFSPSLLLTLNDSILSYPLVKYCLKSYRGDYKNEYDPFISPIQMEDYILKHMPPTRIFTGSSDPLRDDSIRLLDKLTYYKI